MKRRLLLLVGVTALLATLVSGFVFYEKQRTASQWELASIIGIIYPPLPPDIALLEGRLIENGVDAWGGISIIATPLGTALILEDIHDYKDGEWYWEVLDALLLPELKDGEYFALYCGGYAVNGSHVVADPELVALVRTTDDAAWTDLQRAWRTDPEGGSITEIPPGDIVCHNDILAPYYP